MTKRHLGNLRLAQSYQIYAPSHMHPPWPSPLPEPVVGVVRISLLVNAKKHGRGKCEDWRTRREVLGGTERGAPRVSHCFVSYHICKNKLGLNPGFFVSGEPLKQETLFPCISKTPHHPHLHHPPYHFPTQTPNPGSLSSVENNIPSSSAQVCQPFWGWEPPPEKKQIQKKAKQRKPINKAGSRGGIEKLVNSPPPFFL